MNNDPKEGYGVYEERDDGSLIPRGFATEEDDADLVAETLSGLFGMDVVQGRTTEEYFDNDWKNSQER